LEQETERPGIVGINKFFRLAAVIPPQEWAEAQFRVSV
jgi:hypothetical protein